MEVEGEAACGVPEELSEAQVLTGGSPPTGADKVLQLPGTSFLQVDNAQEESPKWLLISFGLESPALAIWPLETKPNPRKNAVHKDVQRVSNSEKYSKMV